MHTSWPGHAAPSDMPRTSARASAGRCSPPQHSPTWCRPACGRSAARRKAPCTADMLADPCALSRPECTSLHAGLHCLTAPPSVTDDDSAWADRTRPGLQFCASKQICAGKASIGLCQGTEKLRTTIHVVTALDCAELLDRNLVQANGTRHVIRLFCGQLLDWLGLGLW